VLDKKGRGRLLLYDVIVVGGGPAGLSAARAAALKGVSVLVVEQEQSIAEHVRTSGVTWMTDAKELGIPRELYNPVSGYRFVSPGNKASIKSSSPEACVLDVRRTYQHLAELAGDAGAVLRLRTRVIRPVLDQNKRVEGVMLSSSGVPEEEVRAGLVIDASGFHSVIAKDLGMAPEWVNYGVGAEYEALAENVREDEWYLMVGSAYSPAGYAWIFPVGGRRVRIGVGVGRPHSKANPVGMLDRLMLERPGPLAGYGRLTPLEFHYGLVPNEGLRSRLVGNGVALVGDSAGQGNPLVLEGIRYAIRYGRLLGECAPDALSYGIDLLKQRYETVCRNEVESKIKAALRVQSRWLGLDDAGWDKELDIINELSPQEFMQFIRSDFSTLTMARLATKHPKLAVREFFALAKGALQDVYGG